MNFLTATLLVLGTMATMIGGCSLIAGGLPKNKYDLSGPGCIVTTGGVVLLVMGILFSFYV